MKKSGTVIYPIRFVALFALKEEGRRKEGSSDERGGGRRLSLHRWQLTSCWVIANQHPRRVIGRTRGTKHPRRGRLEVRGVGVSDGREEPERVQGCAAVVTPLRQYADKCETRRGPPSPGDTLVLRKPQRRNSGETQRGAELSSRGTSL